MKYLDLNLWEAGFDMLIVAYHFNVSHFFAPIVCKENYPGWSQRNITGPLHLESTSETCSMPHKGQVMQIVSIQKTQNAINT